MGPDCNVIVGVTVAPNIIDWYYSGLRLASSDARWFIRNGRVLGWGVLLKL